MKKNIENDLIEGFSLSPSVYGVLSLRNGENVTSVFYRPPDGILSSFLPFVNNVFVPINVNRYNVILGDVFNINMQYEFSYEGQITGND